jgi:hypothetical protein
LPDCELSVAAGYERSAALRRRGEALRSARATPDAARKACSEGETETP